MCLRLGCLDLKKKKEKKKKKKKKKTIPAGYDINMDRSRLTLDNIYIHIQWALQTTFEIDDDDAPTPATLSWGSSEELLVGRGALQLYNTAPTPPTCHWRQPLASPARAALLSHNSSYIASVGYQDRLVKVWRRLNFSSEEVHFEFGYLPHPRAVTSVQWRQPFHVDQTTAENILYSFCADGVARVWTGAADGHGCQNLRLWGQVDLVGAIRRSIPRPGDDVDVESSQKQRQPRDEKKKRKKKKDSSNSGDGYGGGTDDLRWAFIISQRDLANATERAVQERGETLQQDQGEDVALQYLLSIANRDTELCVVFDGRGSMSAWALENVGAKTRAKGNIDNVAFVQSKDFDFLGPSSPPTAISSQPPPPPPPPPPHVEILNYCNKTAGNLHLLIHRFDAGVVELFEASIADLLDPTKTIGGRGRLTPRATWSGHSASIKKIVRNYSGRAIVSRTQEGESIVWKHSPGLGPGSDSDSGSGPGVQERQQRRTELLSPKLIPERRHIHRIVLIRGGSFVVFLHHDSVAVWDCRSSAAVPTLMAEHPYDLPGKPLCILVLPRLNRDDVSVAHIATITSERRGVVWEVHLPLPPPNSGSGRDATSRDQVNGHKETTAPPPPPVLQEFCTFTLDGAGATEDLAYVLPVDPAGSSPVVSTAGGFLDIFTRDIAISYTRSGRLEFWTARVVVPDPDPDTNTNTNTNTGTQNSSSSNNSNNSNTQGRKKGRVEWLSTAAAETGIPEPSLVSGSTMKKAALVNRDRSAVSIWDVRGARLEYYAHEGREQEWEPLDLDLDLDLGPDLDNLDAASAAAADHLADPAHTAATSTNTTTKTNIPTTTTTTTYAPVQDLDWTSTPDSQSILAVGYPYRVVLLSQLRFDYLNRGPAWAPLREINIRELTPHPIGDSAWLSGGHLVVGAGNQFFVYDRRFVVSAALAPLLQLRRRQRRRRPARGGGPRYGKPSGKSGGKSGGGGGGGGGGEEGSGARDLFEVVQRLNGPLPVFHPQFLSQCILAARNAAVKRVLLALHRALKYHVEGDVVDDYLGLDLAEFYTEGGSVSFFFFFVSSLLFCCSSVIFFPGRCAMSWY